MIAHDLVLYDEEYQRIHQVLQQLLQDSGALLVFLVDKSGQQIAAVGDHGALDTTSLASLTAGNVAATEGLARLIGEKEFTVLVHEGEKESLHISIVARRMILVVIFDQRVSLGLVRLRVRRAASELETVFEEVGRKAASDKQSRSSGLKAPLLEITDDDIDGLFSD